MDEPEDEEELLSEEGLALLLVSASEASADEDVEVGAASGFEADDFWEVCAGVEEGCGEEGVSALELGGGDEEEDGGGGGGEDVGGGVDIAGDETVGLGETAVTEPEPEPAAESALTSTKECDDRTTRERSVRVRTADAEQ